MLGVFLCFLLVGTNKDQLKSTHICWNQREWWFYKNKARTMNLANEKQANE
jgi:hypothetical protein